MSGATGAVTATLSFAVTSACCAACAGSKATASVPTEGAAGACGAVIFATGISGENGLPAVFAIPLSSALLSTNGPGGGGG